MISREGSGAPPAPPSRSAAAGLKVTRPPDTSQPRCGGKAGMGEGGALIHQERAAKGSAARHM